MIRRERSPHGFDSPCPPDSATVYSGGREVSLCEILDRVLAKGVVLNCEIVVSIADIELLYVGLDLVLGSVETLLDSRNRFKERIPHETQ